MRMYQALLTVSLGLALLAPLTAANIPRPAAPLEFVSNTGEVIRLSDLKGKVVIIEFLLTHCPTCQQNAKLLSKFQAEFGPKGLQVLGLAIDEGAGPKIPDFISKTGTNFPVGVYKNSAAYEYLQFPMIGPMMMPQIAIVDRKGVIREQHGATEPFMAPASEEANLRTVLQKLLAEGASPLKKAGVKK